MCCLYWPCWVFSVQLMLLINVRASLELCLAWRISFSFVSFLFTGFFYFLHVKYVKPNTKWNRLRVSFIYLLGYMGKMCHSLWLCQNGSSALFRDHGWSYRLTLLMGLVQYQNWGNALSIQEKAYLSGSVHACVSTKWRSGFSSLALALVAVATRKSSIQWSKIFPAVVGSTILYCVYSLLCWIFWTNCKFDEV